MAEGAPQGWDRDEIQRWYVHERMSPSAIGKRLEPPWSGFRVQRLLDEWGVPRRESADPKTSTLRTSITYDDIQRVYVDEGHSIQDTARILGVTASLLRSRMSELRIKTRRGPWVRPEGRIPLSQRVLHEMIVERRLSIPAAAAELGYTRSQVASAIQRHGIVQPPASMKPSLLAHLGAAEMWWLHHHEQLSVKRLAIKFSTDPRTVRRRLAEVGVTARTDTRRTVAPQRPEALPEPNQELIAQLLEAAALRYAESGSAPPALADVSADDLRRLNHQERLSLDEIGERHNCSESTVYAHFVRLGVDYRARQRRTPALTWTVDRQRRLASLYDRADVIAAIGRVGIDRVDPAEPPTEPYPLTREILEELYVSGGLSLEAVGLLTCRGITSVKVALRQHDIAVRPSSVPHPILRVSRGRRSPALEADALATYAANGLGAAEIARRLNVPSPTTVKIAAQAYRVPVDGNDQPPDVPAEVLDAIRRAEVDPSHAAHVLDPRRSAPACTWPAWPWPIEPSLLRHLCVTLELNSLEVARRLRISQQVLSGLLVDAGITITQRQRPVFARWRFDANELRDLYVVKEWSMAAIAEHLGVSRAVVYQAVHRLHIPVAVRSGPPDGVPKRVLYDDLIADHRVRRALAQHGVEPVGIDPPTRKLPLPDGLLQDLLVGIGLSPFQIELLTGRTGSQIRADLGPGHRYLRDRGHWNRSSN